MQVDRAKEAGISVDLKHLGQALPSNENAPLEERWIISRFNQCVADVNRALADYRFDDAANRIYQFFWGEFCDWYLEVVKIRLDFGEAANRATTTEALATLLGVFESSLRLLSPFMPFLTEEIWTALYDGAQPLKSIALARFPGEYRSSINGVRRKAGRCRPGDVLVAGDHRGHPQPSQGTRRTREGGRTRVLDGRKQCDRGGAKQ